MNELIGSKEAKLAWANGEDLEFKIEDNSYFYKWTSIMCRDADLSLSDFERDDIVFKLKPRTITLNGIEVPAPFEPKDGEKYWYITDDLVEGYGDAIFTNNNLDEVFIGKWRTKEEINKWLKL